MFKRKLKLNKDKTYIILVDNPLQMRSWYKSVTKTEKFRFCFWWKFTSQISICRSKKEAIGGLLNIAKTSKFIDRESKLKLVHGLILTQINFRNAFLDGLPNTDLHSLQMIMNDVVSFIAIMPRYNTVRMTQNGVEIYFLPVKPRIEYKKYLSAHKSLLFGEPRYSKNLLQPVQISSLRSSTSNRLIESFL